jgi:hypothetical protein
MEANVLKTALSVIDERISEHDKEEIRIRDLPECVDQQPYATSEVDEFPVPVKAVLAWKTALEEYICYLNERLEAHKSFATSLRAAKLGLESELESLGRKREAPSTPAEPDLKKLKPSAPVVSVVTATMVKK